MNPKTVMELMLRNLISWNKELLIDINFKVFAPYDKIEKSDGAISKKILWRNGNEYLIEVNGNNADLLLHNLILLVKKQGYIPMHRSADSVQFIARNKGILKIKELAE